MIRRVLLPLLCLSLGAGTTMAAGVNLSWDDCGANGVKNKTQPCSSELGANILVASVVPERGASQLVGFEALVDVQVQANTLPDWWEVGVGCRANRLTADFSFVSGPYSCRDLWEGQAAGGVIVYEQEPGNGRSYFKVVGAVANAIALSPGDEYYLFKLNLLNLGTSACDGCSVPACIQLTNVLLVQPAGVGDHLLDDYAFRNVVNWQGGLVTADSDLGNCRADAVQNRSWGQVKSLYR